MRKTFKSAIHEHLSLHVGGLSNGKVSVGIYEGNKLLNGLTVADSDAPALALVILEAAGCPEDDANSATRTIMQYLRCVIEFDERKAKEAAALEKLTSRRNEVMNELRGDSTGSYDRCTTQFQRAIDRIIELEDKAQS